MPEFTDRLLRCARELCAAEPDLRALVDAYAPLLVEPVATTREIALDVFPAPGERQWDRDRQLILEMIRAETGEDLSDALSYPSYLAARARGRLLVTTIDAVTTCRVNVVPVPLEEAESRDDWAFMMSGCGNAVPIRDTAWLIRVVREEMTDAWTGFALVEFLTFIHALILSEELPTPPGYRTLADAFRDTDDPTCALALKVAISETRRQLLLRLFPDGELRRIPYGLVPHSEAILAYKELALEDLARRTGPPSHAAEADLRETVLTEATIAQCVGIHMLPSVMAQLLNSP